MIRFIASLLVILFTCNTPALAQPSCLYHPKRHSETTAALKRGINLSQWWQEGRNAPDVSDIRQLRASGFDFVRLPIDPSRLEGAAEQAERLEALRCDLVMLLDHGMTVVLDLHASNTFRRDNRNPELLLSRLETAWRIALPALKALPPQRVLLGLYNEPDMEAASWWKLQENLVKVLRPVFPHHTFIVAAGPHSSAWELSQMTPYHDKNIIYDFHFYSPMFLTHHGANWRGDYTPQEQFDRIIYPVNRVTISDEDSQPMHNYAAEGWNRAKLDTVLKPIRKWKKRYNVKVACLEFGIYRAHVEEASRYRWLEDTRKILDQAAMPWALWEYRGGFGLIDSDAIVDKGILSALGLSTH